MIEIKIFSFKSYDNFTTLIKITWLCSQYIAHDTAYTDFWIQPQIIQTQDLSETRIQEPDQTNSLESIGILTSVNAENNENKTFERFMKSAKLQFNSIRRKGKSGNAQPLQIGGRE